MATGSPYVAVRGSTGISIHCGPPSYELVSAFKRDDSKFCKCMLFSPQGDYFAWANGKKVTIVNTSNWEVIAELDKPRVCALDFSPKGTYLATWELLTSSPDVSNGHLNLNIYKSENGEHLYACEQKRQTKWEPLWTGDEEYCTRNFKNDILFMKSNNLKEIENKLANQRIHDYSISPGGPPYHILCYIPGKQGQPSLGKLFQYPKFDTPIACKSFFQADSVDAYWNKKGTGVLLMTTVEVDKTGSSYYGKQTLHFLSTKGETSIVQLSKEGPIHSVAWSPQSHEFCVIYGFMPSKATIFNIKCEPVFELGTGPRNSIYYNPHGNILLLGGFGNLPGNVELWEVPARKFITKMVAQDTTLLSWSPEGTHFLTATTAPRLRICNGFKVWHYSGALLYERPWNKQEELWEVLWQRFPDGAFKLQPVSYKPVEGIASSQPAASKEAYRPPTARGKPVTFKLNDEEPVPAGAQLSKSALKMKKKREAKKAAKAQANEVANDGAASASPPPPKPQTNGLKTHLGEFTSDDPVKMKKMGRLKSKLMEIERLKEQQKAGKQLEINQLEKIKKEDQLLKEMRELAL
uniref:Eukaryotic translation initiation factor 2A n=2 Tax=Triatoma infestans TaxID=30076 RepID=A0A023F2J8_TRIIF